MKTIENKIDNLYWTKYMVIELCIWWFCNFQVSAVQIIYTLGQFCLPFLLYDFIKCSDVEMKHLQF